MNASGQHAGVECLRPDGAGEELLGEPSGDQVGVEPTGGDGGVGGSGAAAQGHGAVLANTFSKILIIIEFNVLMI